MRPRVFPAEDYRKRWTGLPIAESFNEAAGIPRGRLSMQEHFGVSKSSASMRPRVFPAEDLCRSTSCLPAPELQ